MTAYLIPTLPDLPFPLGRAGVSHDPLNRDFRALVRPGPRAVRPNLPWRTQLVLDQGSSPRCTTEAAIGLLETNPNRPQYTPDRPRFGEPAERQAAYLQWQRFDPWAATPHDGSSTDAPFKGLREASVITGWRWLFGEPEVREFVTWYGPVAGGHAYRLVQYSRVRDAYRIVNSWGRGWGQNGRAWIRAVDLAALLADDGEAVTVAVA